VEAAGIELPTQNTGETSFSHQGGAESGAVEGEMQKYAPDLATVIAAWPHLSETIRISIVAMVQKID
jgi:hypothetical protein